MLWPGAEGNTVSVTKARLGKQLANIGRPRPSLANKHTTHHFLWKEKTNVSHVDRLGYETSRLA